MSVVTGNHTHILDLSGGETAGLFSPKDQNRTAIQGYRSSVECELSFTDSTLGVDALSSPAAAAPIHVYQLMHFAFT